jgi:hypothetical protein
VKWYKGWEKAQYTAKIVWLNGKKGATWIAYTAANTALSLARTALNQFKRVNPLSALLAPAKGALTVAEKGLTVTEQGVAGLADLATKAVDFGATFFDVRYAKFEGEYTNSGVSASGYVWLQVQVVFMGKYYDKRVYVNLKGSVSAIAKSILDDLLQPLGNLSLIPLPG